LLIIRLLKRMWETFISLRNVGAVLSQQVKQDFSRHPQRLRECRDLG
jgi:hypothetical protein